MQELRKRRAEVVRANAFGDQVQARLVPSSSFGLTELWRIFKVFNKPKVDKAKCVIKEGKGKKEADDKNGDSQPPIEAATVLDDSEGSGHDRDTKRALLQILAGIADLHERVKKSVVALHLVLRFSYQITQWLLVSPSGGDQHLRICTPAYVCFHYFTTLL